MSLCAIDVQKRYAGQSLFLLFEISTNFSVNYPIITTTTSRSTTKVIPISLFKFPHTFLLLTSHLGLSQCILFKSVTDTILQSQRSSTYAQNISSRKNITMSLAKIYQYKYAFNIMNRARFAIRVLTVTLVLQFFVTFVLNLFRNLNWYFFLTYCTHYLFLSNHPQHYGKLSTKYNNLACHHLLRSGNPV